MASIGGIDEDNNGWFVKSSYLFIKKPIHETKYLLVSWRMSGSEFVKELIRENFPECINRDHWGKTHIPLPDEMLYIMKSINVKVFFIICDPRDSSTHINYHENGIHKNCGDYTQYAYHNPKSLEFLNENIEITIKLINFYKTHFNNFIVLKYEDAIYNQQFLLKKVSDFLKLKPLNIDDNRKYKSIIYKHVGVFDKYFDIKILNDHYNKYEFFYRKHGYSQNGFLMSRKIINENVDYVDFLNRNHFYSVKIPHNSQNGIFNQIDINNRIKGVNNI
jgi:hypothetical protein